MKSLPCRMCLSCAFPGHLGAHRYEGVNGARLPLGPIRVSPLVPLSAVSASRSVAGFPKRGVCLETLRLLGRYSFCGICPSTPTVWSSGLVLTALPSHSENVSINFLLVFCNRLWTKECGGSDVRAYTLSSVPGLQETHSCCCLNEWMLSPDPLTSPQFWYLSPHLITWKPLKWSCLTFFPPLNSQHLIQCLFHSSYLIRLWWDKKYMRS